MSEKTMRARLVKNTKHLHGLPVENQVKPGTPDYNCCLGWIELKWMRRWPRYSGTCVKIEHFTPQQRTWLRRRWEVDRRAWLLLQVGQEYLLFGGITAAREVGKVHRRRLYEIAQYHWKKGMNYEELERCLRNLVD